MTDRPFVISGGGGGHGTPGSGSSFVGVSPSRPSRPAPILGAPSSPAAAAAQSPFVVRPVTPTTLAGPQRHCAFVLLAEFDILKGSQLRHQYPRPTKIKESLIAESMLPEGAHLRESDWTVSFLSNVAMQTADVDLRAQMVKAREKAEKDGSPEALATVAASEATYVSEVELQDQGYLVVLNLVRTKMDRTVARGAIVKALAICTRHRFYNIFKNLLMLTLDQYFEAPPSEHATILANLYHTINNMPLNTMPGLSPLQQRLTRATRLRTAANPSAGDYFMTSVKWDAPPSTSSSSAASSGNNLALPPSATSSPSSGPPPAASSPSAAVLPMRIPLSMESDEVLEASVMTLVSRFQSGVMDIYTALLAEKRVLFLGYQQPASICCECVLSACLLISPPVEGTIHRAFPYANLTNMSFLEVPGYIAGVTNPIFETRTQWWDLLCNISNGEVTLSPAYAEEIAQANANAKVPVPTASLGMPTDDDGVLLDNAACLSQLDAAFFDQLLAGVRLRYGEEWTRCMFRDLTHHFLLLVDDEEQFVFDDQGGAPMPHGTPPTPSVNASAATPTARTSLPPPLPQPQVGAQRAFHLAANAHRISAFTKSRQCAKWRGDKLAFERDESAFRDMDAPVRRYVRTLQLLASPNGGGSGSAPAATSCPRSVDHAALYSDLASLVHTRDQVLELLAMLPESRGGLFPLAVGLLHRDVIVRTSTIDLLQRIDAHPEGNKSVSGLNYYILMTYYRFVREAGRQLPDYSGEDEDDFVPQQPLSFSYPAVRRGSEAPSPPLCPLTAATLCHSPSSEHLASIPIAETPLFGSTTAPSDPEPRRSVAFTLPPAGDDEDEDSGDDWEDSEEEDFHGDETNTRIRAPTFHTSGDD